MKVTKVELMIVDFDNVGEDEIKDVLESARYPNRCISPEVMKMTTVDIGEWSDEHPLNSVDDQQVEYERLFPS